MIVDSKSCGHQISSSFQLHWSQTAEARDSATSSAVTILDVYEVPSVVMDFLIRFVQIHETFRKPEIEALALLANVNVEFLFYSENVCLAFFLLESFVFRRNSIN